jgi:hypothetical protein
MTTLATRPQTQMSGADLWNEEQKKAIRDLLVGGQHGKNVSDAQLALYGEVCRRTALDPFTRQIYLIPTDQGPKIHISIDGLRAIAHRSGQPISISTYWKAKGGDWQDAWEGPGEPFAALAVVRRGGGEHRAVVLMSEFKGRSPNWSQKPAHQLGIVAERHALRKACPYEIAGTVKAATGAGVSVIEADEEPDEPRAVLQASTPESHQDEQDASFASRAVVAYRRLVEEGKALGLTKIPTISDDAPDELVAGLTEKLQGRIAEARAEDAR